MHNFSTNSLYQNKYELDVDSIQTKIIEEKQSKNDVSSYSHDMSASYYSRKLSEEGIKKRKDADVERIKKTYLLKKRDSSNS